MANVTAQSEKGATWVRQAWARIRKIHPVFPVFLIVFPGRRLFKPQIH